MLIKFQLILVRFGVDVNQILMVLISFYSVLDWLSSMDLI